MRWLERLRSLEEKSAFLESATAKTAKSLSYSFCSTSSQECEISHAAFGQAGVVTSAPLDPGPLLPPPEWIKGVSLLTAMARPARLRAERWQQVVADAGRFLRDWAAQAAALGWTTLDVFGAHPTHPVERIDCAGLILLLRSHELVAFTAEAGHIRTRTGAMLVYSRRLRSPAVPLWDLAAEAPAEAR